MGDDGGWITDCVCGDNHTQEVDCVTCKSSDMVCCDKCETWKHLSCLNMAEEELPTHFVCPPCLEGKSNRKSKKKKVVARRTQWPPVSGVRRDKKPPPRRKEPSVEPPSRPRKPSYSESASRQRPPKRSSRGDADSGSGGNEIEAEEPPAASRFVQQQQQHTPLPLLVGVEDMLLTPFRGASPPPVPVEYSLTRGRVPSPLRVCPRREHPLRRVSPPLFRPLRVPPLPTMDDAAPTHPAAAHGPSLTPIAPRLDATEQRRRQRLGASLDTFVVPPTFDSLPLEVQLYVLSFLDLPSLLNAGVVSTQWLALTTTPALWRKLDLCGAAVKVTDQLIVALSSRLADVESVNLATCGQITDATLYSLAATCERLTDVNIAFCTAITDAGVMGLCAGVPGLTSLNLAGCIKVGADSVRAVSELCAGIRHLDVSFTGADAESVERLGRLKQLQYCNLYGCAKIENFAAVEKGLRSRLRAGAVLHGVTEFGAELPPDVTIITPPTGGDVLGRAVKLMQAADIDDHIVEAKQLLREAIDATGSVVARTYLAGLHVVTSAVESAAEECRAALAANPHYGNAYVDLAGCFLEQNKLLEAAANYERALAAREFIAWTVHQPNAGLARVLLRQRRIGPALRQLYYAHRRAPWEVSIRTQLIRWAAGLRSGRV